MRPMVALRMSNVPGAIHRAVAEQLLETLNCLHNMLEQAFQFMRQADLRGGCQICHGWSGAYIRGVSVITYTQPYYHTFGKPWGQASDQPQVAGRDVMVHSIWRGGALSVEAEADAVPRTSPWSAPGPEAPAPSAPQTHCLRQAGLLYKLSCHLSGTGHSCTNIGQPLRERAAMWSMPMQCRTRMMPTQGVKDNIIYTYIYRYILLGVSHQLTETTMRGFSRLGAHHCSGTG